MNEWNAYRVNDKLFELIVTREREKKNEKTVQVNYS